MAKEERGDIDAADVEITPNPGFKPDVVDADPDPADVPDKADHPEE
jgi:hypothetical protein